jgi:hypothetical protein
MTYDQPIPLDYLVETLDRRYCHPATATSPQLDSDVAALLDVAAEVPDLREQLEAAQDEATRLADWLRDYADQLLLDARDPDEVRRIARAMRETAKG